MKKSFGLSTVAVLCLLQVAAPARVGGAADKEAEKPKECCFTREGARQVCRVTPGEDETCASVLAYLNTPGTTGKAYCGGNKLRGGWLASDCAKDDSGEERSQE